MKFFKTIYYAFIGAIALIAVLLIISVFPITGNFKVLTVLSGSMEPKIKTGSVVMVKGAADYKVGDVVTFGNSKTPTTHRIVEIAEEEYVTKGDANNAPDMNKVSQNKIIGKALFSIPYLGYAVNAAQKPLGFALVIIIPALMIILGEVFNIQKEVKKIVACKKSALIKTKMEDATLNPTEEKSPPKKESSAHKLLMLFLLLNPLLVLICTSNIGGTQAYFMDEEKTTATITAWVEEASAQPGDVIINEVMWMGSRTDDNDNKIADEWIELRNMTDHEIDIGQWRIENAKNANAELMIPASKLIPANGYFLIANYPENSVNTLINVVVDEVSNLGLHNTYSTNGSLVLKDDDGNIIDQTPPAISSDWPAGVNESSKKWSMEKNDMPSDSWHTCDPTTMTSEKFALMHSYWKANAQNYNCGTPGHDNLSNNDPTNLEEEPLILQTAIVPAEIITEPLAPDGETPQTEQAPDPELNNGANPENSQTEPPIKNQEEDSSAPANLEPDQDQEEDNSADNPDEALNPSPVPDSETSQSSQESEDSAPNNTPPDTNNENNDEPGDAAEETPPADSQGQGEEQKDSSPETQAPSSENPSPDYEGDVIENQNQGDGFTTGNPEGGQEV